MRLSVRLFYLFYYLWDAAALRTQAHQAQTRRNSSRPGWQPHSSVAARVNDRNAVRCAAGNGVRENEPDGHVEGPGMPVFL